MVVVVVVVVVVVNRFLPRLVTRLDFFSLRKRRQFFGRSLSTVPSTKLSAKKLNVKIFIFFLYEFLTKFFSPAEQNANTDQRSVDLIPYITVVYKNFHNGCKQ